MRTRMYNTQTNAQGTICCMVGQRHHASAHEASGHEAAEHHAQGSKPRGTRRVQDRQFRDPGQGQGPWPGLFDQVRRLWIAQTRMYISQEDVKGTMCSVECTIQMCSAEADVQCGLSHADVMCVCAEGRMQKAPCLSTQSLRARSRRAPCLRAASHGAPGPGLQAPAPKPRGRPQQSHN